MVAQTTIQRTYDPDFAALCEKAGIKATPQRRAIYAELAGTDEHPDTETVFRRLKRRRPALSLDTVYRNVRLFEANGLIRKVGTGYRTRFDANLNRHHHFICTECGRIADIFDAQLDQALIPSAAVEAIGKTQNWHIEIKGLCRTCAPNPLS